MVTRVLKTIIHLELRQIEVRRGILVQHGGDDDMSSNAPNVGSKPLRWEGDLMGWGLLTGRWSDDGEEKSYPWIQTMQGRGSHSG